MAGSKSLFHVCVPFSSKNASFNGFYTYFCIVQWPKGGGGAWHNTLSLSKLLPRMTILYFEKTKTILLKEDV